MQWWYVPKGVNPYLWSAGVVAAVLLYIYIFSRSYKIGLAILFACIVTVIYFFADWQYWDEYFKVGWDMSRYR